MKLKLNKINGVNEQLFYKSALHIAAQNNYIEIVKILLMNPKTNINLRTISNIFHSSNFEYFSFHCVFKSISFLYKIELLIFKILHYI